MEVETLPGGPGRTTGHDSSPVSSPPSSPPEQGQHRSGAQLGFPYPTPDFPLHNDKVAPGESAFPQREGAAGGPSSAAKQQPGGPDTVVTSKPQTKKKSPSTATAPHHTTKNNRSENGASTGATVNSSNTTATTTTTTRKPRKPREPRDPNNPPKPRKKKQKLIDDGALANGHTHDQFPGFMRTSPSPSANQGPPTYGPPLQQRSSQSGNSLKPEHARFESLQQQQSPRPASSNTTTTTSKQRYDPIRAAFTSTDDVPEKKAQFVNYAPVAAKSPNRTSPSLASLVHQSADAPIPNLDGTGAAYTSYSIEKSVNGGASSVQPASNTQKRQPAKTQSFGPMDIDAGSLSTVAQPQNKLDGSKDAPSPKPVKQKGSAAPIPLGNGLLSSAAFGGASATPREYSEVPNQCIVIDVPMKSKNGNYVNFMKEVEQKYGFDVAHPAVAEHRKRLKEVAAAGGAIESGPGSADEMILDNSDGDSNAEMGGMEGGSAAEGQKRKRRPKADEYNKDDDFIDDTEMLWEEQALASKDGYFVWCGPLITEGNKPTVEKTDGTVRRGGRGRGRGGATRGETTGRTRGGGRGGGRGSRGGAAVRKPRVTKGDRAQMESEKAERERMAASVVKPSNYPGTMLP